MCDIDRLLGIMSVRDLLLKTYWNTTGELALLRKKDDRCVLLTEDDRCSIYAHRPTMCRAFPLSCQDKERYKCPAQQAKKYPRYIVDATKRDREEAKMISIMGPSSYYNRFKTFADFDESDKDVQEWLRMVDDSLLA